MTTETIDHITLSNLTEAGVVQSAHIVGQAGGWNVWVKYGLTERVLAAQRSHKMRIFRKLETLVSYLRSLGIVQFDVDAKNYDPENVATTRTRPDSAAKMKSAHEAAAYDTWLKAEIQEAIDDTGPNFSHEQVMAEVQAIIDAKRKQHANKTKR